MDWKFHNESSAIERPDVFFFKFTLGMLSFHPPIRTPLVFSFCQVQKNDMCRNMVIMGCGEATRWNTVTVGWEFHELLSYVARTQKQGEFTQTTGIFSLKNILAHYMYNGRQVRLYVLVGTWTNEIPHWKPFFTNVEATVQSFPQWSMFSAVQEMSSYYKKLVVFISGTLYRLYVNKSLYIRIPDPYEATSLLGMSWGCWVLNAVQLHTAIFFNCIIMVPQHNGMNQTLNEPAKSCNSPNYVALGFPGLSMAPSITAQHARVRQCHSGCVLVGRCGWWVWSLNEKTEI